MAAAQPLTLVNIILIIGFGGVGFLILFIFAKRQIMRFALKSRRGPHASIGHNAPKYLKEEIERRINRVNEIKHEPKLLEANDYRYRFLQGENPTGEQITYIYRMKAVDAMTLLDEQLRELDPQLCRQPGYSVREHLLDLREGPIAPLKAAKLSLVRAFADSYEHARHGFKPFGEAEYMRYMGFLNEILNCIRNKIQSQEETGTVIYRKKGSSLGSSVDMDVGKNEKIYMTSSGSTIKDSSEFIKMNVVAIGESHESSV
ncbi:protein C1orf43 homolog isoform X2 [Ptychodera flava]|uniref:protein C1orf43 homolog isoform X2 n=1 Tax=Ptychodera flava TaxID=63121 RepID=UPI00396A2B18